MTRSNRLTHPPPHPQRVGPKGPALRLWGGQVYSGGPKTWAGLSVEPVALGKSLAT